MLVGDLELVDVLEVELGLVSAQRASVRDARLHLAAELRHLAVNLLVQLQRFGTRVQVRAPPRAVQLHLAETRGDSETGTCGKRAVACA